MKKLLLLFLFAGTALFAQYKDGEELLRAMHKKYYHNYCQTITFDQKTIRYDTNGVAKDTSYWYEWISYPDKFRIDFGKKFGGNCVIFKNDSVFNYRNHKLVRKGKDENDLLLILGGMYFRKFDDVVKRLERAHYDLKKLNKWCTETCTYAIGSEKEGPGLGGSEIYVSADKLKVEQVNMKIADHEWLSIRFDSFAETCKGYTETRVTALKNWKVEQKEEYLNLKTSIAIPDSIFNKKP